MKREEMALIWGLVAVLLIMLIWQMSKVETRQAGVEARMITLEDRQAVLTRDVSLGISVFWTQADQLLREIQSYQSLPVTGMPSGIWMTKE